MSEASVLLPSRLESRWLGRTARSLDVVGSTNTELWRWALEGDAAPHGAMLVAAAQSEGRGRQGRDWRSPRGNLYVSILLRPSIPIAACAAWPLVVGLTLVEALEEATSVFALALKWPNDVLHTDRKLAGILLESRSDPAAVVVGVGLNLRTPEVGWGELEEQAVALDALGGFLTPASVLGAWLPRLERAWERFEAEGFGAFHEAYARRSNLEGRRVRWAAAADASEFVVSGVGEDGALLLRDAEGRQHRVHAGEIHLGRDA